MPERGTVKLNIQRGASVAEFCRFLADLEGAYLALYNLPSRHDLRRYRTRLPFLIEYLEFDLFARQLGEKAAPMAAEIYPEDRLEITRISIRSPGWIELSGIASALRELRELFKDRHERKKDHTWREDADRQRAILENEILRAKAERERTGAISDYNELLESIGLSPEERQRAIWERLGPTLIRLGHHQDTGLLGSQNDEIDGTPKETE